MIDFTELPSDGSAFEQLVRELLLIADLHPQWSGKGPDQGRDILISERSNGYLDTFNRRWLVQCKHFAHAGRSVGRDDVGSVIDDCRQVGATGYFLVCSTQPSSSLVTKLDEIRNRPENGLVTKIWDAVDIEKRLQEPRCFSLGHIFFPRSFSNTPWKIYNKGAPNRWTAHYKSYFLHLNSRIAGQYPDLNKCRIIIERLETITPNDKFEAIRPRAIYFDDKHTEFTVFADYLVLHNQEPSLRPSDFNIVLGDGQEPRSGGVMWCCTDWDIQLRRISPSSDHFHLDHNDYYNSDSVAFESGFPRGRFIGDVSACGNRWHAA